MTKAQLQAQLEQTETAYYNLYSQIEELKNIIKDGNKETSEPRMPSDSIEFYEYYNDKLKRKAEDITGIKIDFCYFTY